jgi:DNA-binding transcriptional regulator YhcF (GntR family)
MNKKVRKADNLRENERKWGKKLWGLGWVAVPSVILKYQDELKMDGVDLALVMQLVRHWWYRDREPFPSLGELGRCLKVSKSTVQRRLKKLSTLGYIKSKERYDSKHGGQTSNAYDILGLAMAAEKWADKEIDERKKIAERDESRYMRRKGLAVVG